MHSHCAFFQNYKIVYENNMKKHLELLNVLSSDNDRVYLRHLTNVDDVSLHLFSRLA